MQIKHIYPLFLGLLLFGATSTLGAQDMPFSLYQCAPMLANPANVGHIEGKFRMNLLYRNQWSGSYKTSPLPLVSLDGNISLGDEGSKSLGLGFMTYSDFNAANGVYKSTVYSFLLGGHLKLADNQYLSAGFQPLLYSRRVDITALNFNSEYNGASEQFDGANTEVLPQNKLTNFDMSLGVQWSGYFDKGGEHNMYLKGGISLNNALGNHKAFMGDTANNQNFRLGINADAGIFLGKSKATLLRPHLYVATSRKSTRMILGATVEHNLNKTALIAGTAYNTAGGAIDLTLGLRFTTSKVAIQVMGAYDIATSSAIKAFGGGSWELSVGFVYCKQEKEEQPTEKESIQNKKAKPSLPLDYF